MRKMDKVIEQICEGVKPTMMSKSESEYIKREDAIIEIERFAGYLDGDMLCRIKLALNRLPSADVVEVRHGQWIGKIYKCSLCGKWVDPLQGDADMNYCPNCGAKMDEKEQKQPNK